MSGRRPNVARLIFCMLTIAAVPAARAQDAEPRSYSNAPVGLNFLIAGYAYTRGGLSLDPALPIDNDHLRTNSGVLAYAHAFGIGGMSAKFDAIVPYVGLSGSALYQGQPVTREVDGLADPRVRVSINLYGAPALSAEDFASYQQDLIVGASIQISAPWGQYDSSRLVNIGTNRWSFRPEIGVSKGLGAWTIEVAGGATFFTDNRDFYGGSIRTQRPVYSAQTHAIYTLPRGMWASLDATYFAGGRTTINDRLDNNLQRNWRLGGTFALPLDRRNSLKAAASTGVSARTGNNFDLLAIAWQYRWGAGI